MSTLVAQTISNGTVSTSSANVIQGSAKAWVYFDGTGTPAIRASYNVSSITDNGTANYTVNFTNAFADANYAITGTAAGPGAGAAHVLVPNVSFDVEYPPSTTSCRVGTLEPGGSWNDVKYIYVAIFR